MATHEPYGSAADIPSIAEMLQQIEGGKLLTRFIARHQRAISPSSPDSERESGIVAAESAVPSNVR